MEKNTTSNNAAHFTAMERISDMHDDNEFDLHQNYHNAIECLLNCEQIINGLQDELKAKDEHIAMLEEKLV